MNLKNTLVEILPNLSGANELITSHQQTYDGKLDKTLPTPKQWKSSQNPDVSAHENGENIFVKENISILRWKSTALSSPF